MKSRTPSGFLAALRWAVLALILTAFAGKLGAYTCQSPPPDNPVQDVDSGAGIPPPHMKRRMP